MTILTFKVDDRDAVLVQTWADRLGVDRSELLREALRRHLLQLSGEVDAATWEKSPMTDTERSLGG